MYDLILISLPFLMIGSMIGASFNRFLPDSILCIIIIIVIYQSSKKTYQNYQQLLQQERSIDHTPTQSIEMQLIENPAPTPTPAQTSTYTIEEDVQKYSLRVEKMLEEIIEQEKIVLPIKKFFQIFLFLVFMVLSLLKGGKTLSSLLKIPYCSIYYQLFNLAIIAVSYGFYVLYS